MASEGMDASAEEEQLLKPSPRAAMAMYIIPVHSTANRAALSLNHAINHVTSG